MNTQTKKEIETLEARLAAEKSKCKGCTRWGCGHCIEPIADLQNAIHALRREEAA